MVLAFGTICVDRIHRVPRLPQAGGYVEVAEVTEFLGGEAANTANALRAWGAEVILAGTSLEPGDSTLKRLLRESDLLEAYVTSGRSAEFTPVCDILVTPDGGRTMFGHGFSTMGQFVDPSALPFRTGDWFTADPNMLAESRQAIELASAAGMRLYLMDFVREADPIPAKSYWQSSTDWAGTRDDGAANIDWVGQWVDRHGCFTILSDGANGFFAGSPDHRVRAYAPFPSTPVVDTTGAGDMFRAGMLFGLDRAWPIADCLRFASVAGSLKCRAFGASVYVPAVHEIQTHIATNPAIAGSYDA